MSVSPTGADPASGNSFANGEARGNAVNAAACQAPRSAALMRAGGGSSFTNKELLRAMLNPTVSSKPVRS